MVLNCCQVRRTGCYNTSENSQSLVFGEEVFELPEEVIELDKFSQEERDYLLVPKGTEVFKIPSMLESMPGSSGDKCEKPLGLDFAMA